MVRSAIIPLDRLDVAIKVMPIETDGSTDSQGFNGKRVSSTWSDSIVDGVGMEVEILSCLPNGHQPV